MFFLCFLGSPGCFPINVHSKFVVSVKHLENMAPNDLFDIHGAELPCTVGVFVKLAGCLNTRVSLAAILEPGQEIPGTEM